MTDNEKRAHDLAIAVMTFKANAELKQAVVKPGFKITYDFFTMYMNAYKEALSKIQSAFPEGDQ